MNRERRKKYRSHGERLKVCGLKEKRLTRDKGVKEHVPTKYYEKVGGSSCVSSFDQRRRIPKLLNITVPVEGKRIVIETK
ncbi:MAG: hypothetical protein ACE5LG_02505 [Anaerolineae bacterium]